MRIISTAFLVLSVSFTTTVAHGQLCSENFNSNSGQAINQRGYVGEIKGKKIFYEAWNLNAGTGTNYSTIVLRTDTIYPDYNEDTISINFCVDIDRQQTDSILVTVSKTDTSSEFWTTKMQQVPTLLQVLKVEYGYQMYWGFNTSSNNIYIKGDKLYLTYNYSPRYDKPFVVNEIYQYTNGKFKRIKPK